MCYKIFLRKAPFFFSDKRQRIIVITIQNNIVTAIPHFIPARLAILPTAHGPIIPPNPAKKKRIPKTVPRCSRCLPAAEAVTVGKIIEKNKPVKGSSIANDVGEKIPEVRIRMENPETILRILICPIRSTIVLPISRPIVMNPKYTDRNNELFTTEKSFSGPNCK